MSLVLWNLLPVLENRDDCTDRSPLLFILVWIPEIPTVSFVHLLNKISRMNHIWFDRRVCLIHIHTCKQSKRCLGLPSFTHAVFSIVGMQVVNSKIHDRSECWNCTNTTVSCKTLWLLTTCFKFCLCLVNFGVGVQIWKMCTIRGIFIRLERLVICALWVYSVWLSLAKLSKLKCYRLSFCLYLGFILITLITALFNWFSYLHLRIWYNLVYMKNVLKYNVKWKNAMKTDIN